MNSTTDFYILCKKVGITIFRWKFLSHGAKKISSGALLCFRKNSGIEIFLAWEGGGFTIFRRIKKVKKCT